MAFLLIKLQNKLFLYERDTSDGVFTNKTAKQTPFVRERYLGWFVQIFVEKLQNHEKKNPILGDLYIYIKYGYTSQSLLHCMICIENFFYVNLSYTSYVFTSLSHRWFADYTFFIRFYTTRFIKKLSRLCLNQ